MSIFSDQLKSIRRINDAIFIFLWHLQITINFILLVNLLISSHKMVPKIYINIIKYYIIKKYIFTGSKSLSIYSSLGTKDCNKKSFNYFLETFLLS